MGEQKRILAYKAKQVVWIGKNEMNGRSFIIDSFNMSYNSASFPNKVNSKGRNTLWTYIHFSDNCCI